MKGWVIALAILVLTSVSCNPGNSGYSAAPEPTPDVPRYTAQTAIGAVVKTLGPHTAFPRMLTEKAVAHYQGRGIWKVGYYEKRTAEWTVDETNGSAMPLTKDATFITQASHTEQNPLGTLPTLPKLPSIND